MSTSNFDVTILAGASAPKIGTAPMPDPVATAGAILELFKAYKEARSTRDTVWQEAWALYLGTPESLDFLRQQVGRIVGDVSDDWRHKISNGKAYEVIETIVGYLVSGFFPSQQWCALIPRDAGQQELARLITKYMISKLDRSQFKRIWEMYIRQLVVCGFSAIALPYREESVENFSRKPVTDKVGRVIYEPVPVLEWSDGFDFEVLSAFDCYVEPLADLNKGNFIRRFTKTKAQVMRLIASGTYDLLDPEKVAALGAERYKDSGHKQLVNFMGIEYDPSDTVDILEFWGDINVDVHTYHNVTVTMVGDQVARFRTNPYWGGKPFIIGSAVPVVGVAHGLGALEPALGMLHEMNIIGNQRLDNLELSANCMWVMEEDGVVHPDEVYSKPGHIIRVTSKDAIAPMPLPNPPMITYQESSVLDSRVDRVTGTGAYIGTAQGRRGERVTAEEINAVRDAGGNRLALLHRGIEESQLIPLLRKVYSQLQQFVDHDEVVRIIQPGGDTAYVDVGASELIYPMDVEAQGATHLVDKQMEQQTIIAFTQMAAQVPQLSERVNWDAITELLVRRFGLNDDADRILNSGAAGMPQQVPGSPSNGATPIAEAINASGGTPAAMKAQEMGPEAMLQQALGNQ